MKMNVLDALRTTVERDSHLAASVRRFEIHLHHKCERESEREYRGDTERTNMSRPDYACAGTRGEAARKLEQIGHHAT